MYLMSHWLIRYNAPPPLKLIIFTRQTSDNRTSDDRTTALSPSSTPRFQHTSGPARLGSSTRLGVPAHLGSSTPWAKHASVPAHASVLARSVPARASGPVRLGLITRLGFSTPQFQHALRPAHLGSSMHVLVPARVSVPARLGSRRVERPQHHKPAGVTRPSRQVRTEPGEDSPAAPPRPPRRGTGAPSGSAKTTRRPSDGAMRRACPSGPGPAQPDDDTTTVTRRLPRQMSEIALEIVA